MTTPTAIRNALADALAAIPDLRVSAYIPSTPTPPQVAVGEWRVEYDETLGRGYDRWRFTLRLFVAAASDRVGQERLDSFCASSGSSSIKAAVEADPTLGGAVSAARVVRIGPAPTVFTAGAQEFLGTDIEIEVIASGT